MLLQRGSKEKDLVSALKERLSKLGYEISDIGGSKGVFGPKVEAAVKDFQKKSGLLADGKVGTMTEMALAAALTSPVKNPKPEVVKPESKGDMPFWVAQMLGRLGWTEFNHDKEIAKDWKWAGLPQYKSVIGKKNAWCGLACEIALRSGGLKGPKGSAAAASWSHFGEECEPICGAFAPIKHSGGGRHIGVFLYWIDEKKQIAAILGGNQSNAYTIASTNLSGVGKADKIQGGFRWPKSYPKSGFVYVPKAKPGKMGSTR